MRRWRNPLLVFVLALIVISPTPVRVQTASVNRLLLTLRQEDLSGVPIINRQIGFTSYNGTVGVFTNAILTDTNAHSQTLPTTNVLQFYFKNTHATATITLTWTPQGGSSNVVKAVGPGGIVSFWETTTGSGITALSIQSNTSNATYEMFLGG